MAEKRGIACCKKIYWCSNKILYTTIYILIYNPNICPVTQVGRGRGKAIEIKKKGAACVIKNSKKGG